MSHLITRTYGMNNEPTNSLVIFDWECAACDAKWQEEKRGTILDPPTWPGFKRSHETGRLEGSAWRELPGGGWLCPKHVLKVEIDGKPWPRVDNEGESA